MDRPSSRTQPVSGDESKTTASTSTARRPATKPAVSTSRTSTLTKPTAASTAARSSTPSSTINKPAARPTTASTISSVRKSTTASTTTPSPSSALHRSRLSTASVDAKPGTTTDDESRQDGISAKPKRMSIVPGSTTTSTSSTRTRTGAVPSNSAARRTSTISTASRAGARSPVTSRAGVRSPTSSRAAATPSRTGATSALSSRSATTGRTATTLAERKRLSTIPGSPAVHTKSTVTTSAASKDKQPAGAASPKRPPLGTRKSTHSALIDQRLHEFSLVSQMLQQAMSTDTEGISAEEKDALDQEAAQTMQKLKTTLGKVRRFEKEHGRQPTEAELADVSTDDEVLSAVPKPPGASAPDDDESETVEVLRAELDESRAYAIRLEAQIEDLSNKMQTDKDLEEEVENATEAAQTLKAETDNKIRDISNTFQARNEHLRNIHREEMDELRGQHQAELEAVMRGKVERDAEIERLQEQIENLEGLKVEIQTLKAETEVHNQKQKEADDLQAQLAALKALSSETGAAHTAEVQSLQAKLEALESSSTEATAAHAAELESVYAELEHLKSTPAPDTSAKDAEIKSLQSELDILKSSQAEAFTNHAAELEKLRAELADLKAKPESAATNAELLRLRAEVEAYKPQVEPAADDSVAATRDVSPSKPTPNGSEDTVDSLRSKLTAFETRHKAAKENAKSKSAKAQEEHAAQLAEVIEGHKGEVRSLQDRISSLTLDVEERRTNLDEAKAEHAKELADLNGMLTEHQNAVQKLKTELQNSTAAQTELEDKIASLENVKKELADLHSSKTDAESAATSTLEKIKAEHQKQLEEVHAQLQSAHEEAKVVAESKSSAEAQAVAKLENELAQIKAELELAQNTHVQALTDLQRQLEEARTEKEAVAAEHESKLTEVQAAAESAAASNKAVQRDLETQVSTAQEQVVAMQSEIEGLRKAHADETAEYDRTAKAAHEDAINKLKKEHNIRLKQLEEDSKASLASLDGIESMNEKRLEKMRVEATTAQEAALAEQKGKYEADLYRVEADLQNLQSLMAEAKTSHAADLESAQKEHAAELQTALNSTKDRDTTLEALKSEHAEQVRQLESKAKDAISEVEGVRFQLQTMKGILRDMEEQSTAKGQAHAEELQKVNDEFSQAVVKIAGHSQKMMEKDNEHTAILDGVHETHTRAIDDLKREHAQAIEEIGRSQEKRIAEEHASLKAEHEEVLESLRSKQLGKDADLEKLKADHAEALQQVRTSIESANKENVSKLQIDHTEALDALQKSLEEQHTDALAKIRAEHDAQIATSSQELSQRLENIKKEHQSVVEQLEADLKTSADTPNNLEALDRANAELEDAKSSIQKLQAEHAQSVATVQKEHEQSLAALHDELTATKSAPRDTTVEDQLKSELAKAEARIVESEQDFAASQKRLAALEDELANAKSKLHLDHSAEVSELKDMIAEATSQSADLKTELTHLKNANAQLNADYQTAVGEAEAQRKKTEHAEKEVQDLRKAATVGVASSVSPVVDKVRSESGSTKSSPKSGLASSKWAEASPRASLAKSKWAVEKEPEAAQSDEASGGEVGLGASGVDTERSVTPNKRNVQGQLAGINEDIRQLNDLSNQFLVENRRMAKVLSKVDDATGNVTLDAAESVDGS